MTLAPWKAIELKWNPKLHPRGPLGMFVKKGGEIDTDRIRAGAGDAMAALQDPEIGGFSFDTREGRVLDIGERQGYMIAVPHTEHIIGSAGTMTKADFADAFAKVALKYKDHLAAGSFLGGWYSEDRDLFMVELTNLHRTTRTEAIRRGARDNQEGVFDIGTGDYIETGGTGG